MQRYRPKRLSLTLVSVLLFVVLKSAAAQASADLSYQQAKMAFSKGLFSQAAALFFDAERLGYREPNLHYNLGVTHFKLGEFQAAAQRFRRLLNEPRWSDLALLNLGVVAQAQGEPALARVYYRDGAVNAKSEALRASFAQHLQAMGYELPAQEVSQPEPTPSAIQTTALLSMAYGADDNPALVDKDIDLPDVDEGSDRFTETYAYGAATFWQSGAHELSASASAYSRNFSSSDIFDVLGSTVAFNYRWQGQRWSLKPNLRLEHYEVDTEAYTSLAGVGVDIRRHGAVQWRLSVAGAHVEAGEHYQFLDGGRYQAMTSIGDALGSNGDLGRWEIGYRYEVNDRRDSRDERRTLDFSPRRGTAFFDVDWQFATRWSTELSLNYRESRYHGRNSLVSGEGSEIVFDKRVDERFAARWALRFRATESLHSVLRLGHQDSHSSLSVYDYRGRQASLALQLQY